MIVSTAVLMSAEIRGAFRGDPVLKQIQQELLDEIQAGIDQKVLVDVPVETIEIILASPAITLARRASLSGVRMDAGELNRVFELVWRGIATPDIK